MNVLLLLRPVTEVGLKIVNYPHMKYVVVFEVLEAVTFKIITIWDVTP
jgi:hypothetical protein